jgi:hypothetical protein
MAMAMTRNDPKIFLLMMLPPFFFFFCCRGFRTSGRLQRLKDGTDHSIRPPILLKRHAAENIPKREKKIEAAVN